MNVREAKKFARTATDADLEFEYRDLKRKANRASLSGSMSITRVTDVLSAEIKRRAAVRAADAVVLDAIAEAKGVSK